MYRLDESKPEDKFAWIFRFVRDKEGKETKEYLAGTAGRMRIEEARMLVEMLNEFSLCVGESR